MGNGRIPFIGAFCLGPLQIPSTHGRVLTDKIGMDVLDTVLVSSSQHKRENSVKGEIKM